MKISCVSFKVPCTPTDKILAIFGVSEFVDEQLHRVWRRTNEAQASQVPHAFSLGVIQTAVEVTGSLVQREVILLDQVNLMIQQC
jgi:hypothetical protein